MKCFTDGDHIVVASEPKEADQVIRVIHGALMRPQAGDNVTWTELPEDHLITFVSGDIARLSSGVIVEGQRGLLRYTGTSAQFVLFAGDCPTFLCSSDCCNAY